MSVTEQKHHVSATEQDEPQPIAIRTQFWWRPVMLGALAIVAGFGLLATLYFFARALALVILAIALAEALVPGLDWLKRWVPRTLAIFLLYLTVLLVLVGIGWFIIPQVSGQLQQAAERIPEFAARLQRTLDGLGFISSSQLLQQLPQQLGQLSSALVSLPLMLVTSLLDILLVIVLSIYWLIDAPGMRQFTLSLFPAPSRERVSATLHRMGQSMGGYVRGIVIDGVIVGVLTYLGLLIIGVNFPLVLGLLAALFELIPFIGPIIAGLVMAVIALLQSTTKGLIVLGFVIALQQLENHLLVPNIMYRQTHVSPLLVIIAILFGSAIGGVLGVLVAVPLSAALRVLIREVVAPAVRRRTGAV